jgi:hypothetical protein
VVLDAAVGIVPKPIQHVHHRADIHVETCFLANLPDKGRLERLADLDGSSWQTPFAFERLVAAFDQQDAIAVEDHGAVSDDRPGWIFPHSPITLRTTRFFRWP